MVVLKLTTALLLGILVFTSLASPSLAHADGLDDFVEGAANKISTTVFTDLNISHAGAVLKAIGNRPLIAGGYVAGTAVGAYLLYRSVWDPRMAALAGYEKALDQLSQATTPSFQRSRMFVGNVSNSVRANFSSLPTLVVSNGTKLQLQRLFPPTNWDAVRVKLTSPVRNWAVARDKFTRPVHLLTTVQNQTQFSWSSKYRPTTWSLTAPTKRPFDLGHLDYRSNLSNFSKKVLSNPDYLPGRITIRQINSNIGRITSSPLQGIR